MKKIAYFIYVIPALFSLVCCYPTSTSDKPNGWYFLDNNAEIETTNPIVVVKDFAYLRLDSGMVANTNKPIYEIIGKVKEAKVKTFADATEKAIGKKIGFLYNDKILNAPSPNMRLESGNFSINLSSAYSSKEAHSVYKELRKEMSDDEDMDSPLTEEEMQRFDSLFMAWKENYRTNPITQISSNTNDAKKLEQYSLLLEMGKRIIPCIITRLPVKNDFFALTLYDDLQDIDSLTCFDYSQGEQYRVQMTLKKYIEAKTGKKKRKFASDKEKIQAIKELCAIHGGEIDSSYTEAEIDSIFLNTEYEIVEDFLMMFNND